MIQFWYWIWCNFVLKVEYHIKKKKKKKNIQIHDRYVTNTNFKLLFIFSPTCSSQKEGCNNHPNSFHPGAQKRVAKVFLRVHLSSTFPLILKKKIRQTSPGVG